MDFSEEEMEEERRRFIGLCDKLPGIATLIVAVILIVYIAVVGVNMSGYVVVLIIAGLAACTLTYLILKIILSYKMLHIHYLKKISEKDKRENKEATSQEENAEKKDEQGINQ